MKSSWKIAALVSCVIPICGAAITRHLVKARADQRKLSEDANVYRARAEQGDAEAQFNLARAYYHGQGVPQDYNGAARWYRKAADQGYAKAEYDLGYMYYKGKGVPQDNSEALLWYRKAADQGYAKAQYAVGYMYFQGKGVPQDHAEAARWYRRAANQGDEYAQRALGSTRMGFTTWSKINLSIVFLGSTLLLIRFSGEHSKSNTAKNYSDGTVGPVVGRAGCF